MATLENEFLKISIRTKGAELTSVFDKTTGTEHLWQGDPAIWAWHAPNLFPVVGGCLNNAILVNGQSYPMERHGFARQSEFTLIKAAPAYALFSLPSSQQTLAVYPYRFHFQIGYRLENRQLTVTYRVINEDNQPVYFSVGAHPAFNVPFYGGEAYEDYYLEFETEETLQQHLLSKAGYFNGQTEPVPLTDRKLFLSKKLFDQDALVFKNLDSRKVTLRSKNHTHHLSVAFQPFPYLGIWAKPGASFVCIEPWLGCADTEGKPVAFEKKEVIQAVAAGAVFEAAFSLGIYGSV